MAPFLGEILHQLVEHTMTCNYLKLEIKKGYKTPFRRSGHILHTHVQLFMQISIHYTPDQVRISFVSYIIPTGNFCAELPDQ